MKWIGIDVGGTFTDLVVYDEETGDIAIQKVPSTPSDQSEGMANAIVACGIDVSGVAKLAHGTTVATNTILERNGCRVAVLTTRGFRDVLEVGRGNRTQLYNVKGRKPKPLISRQLCFEVTERTAFDGTVLQAVSAPELATVLDQIAAENVDAVVVNFLHSYANGANESAARRMIESRLPGVMVSCSSEVMAQLGEYERFAATAVNAYVAPRMKRYLEALEQRLSGMGYTHDISIMTSNGGTIPIPRAVQFPVQTMLSGPAAGVIGAAHVGAAAGESDVITYDMGGTSTDVCLVKDGLYSMTNESSIGEWPNPLTQIEINSIGAGGGSIASLDSNGFLSVGPRSAGAVPGPACYGHGGLEPTVTDANVVLGRLGSGRRLGGQIEIDPVAAHRVVANLAARLGTGVEQAAEGIVKLACVKMTSAIKEISVMRGHDPRDFALFAYGGAGPLHAALIAEELGMSTVVIPPMPGNFSAFGLLVADVRHDIVQTRIMLLEDTSFENLAAGLQELRSTAEGRLAADGFSEASMSFEFALDMRYVGQAFDIPVAIPAALKSTADVRAAFQAAYQRRYAYSSERPVEIVNFRVSAKGGTAKAKLAAVATGKAGKGGHGRRRAVFDGEMHDCAALERDEIAPGISFEGPALVDEYGTTTVVPPGFSVTTDSSGLLILKKVQRQ
jgi:N-methylhydantoinase A